MKANSEQETDAWMQARAGKFTASRSADLMAKTRSGPAASRANLIATLAVERITGECVPTYQNDAMRRGTELEAEARDAYVFATGNDVQETGFVATNVVPNTGCSPDGLIGDDGLLEIKCPASMQKHLDALRDGSHAKEYRWQLQHQLMVTGRKWVEIASYDPRWPADLQLAITRVERDEKAISELQDAIKLADTEVINITLELALRQQKAAP